MNKLIVFCLSIFILLHSHSVFSEAGPPIPKPQISIEKALELSKDQLKKKIPKIQVLNLKILLLFLFNMRLINTY